MKIGEAIALGMVGVLGYSAVTSGAAGGKTPVPGGLSQIFHISTDVPKRYGAEGVMEGAGLAQQPFGKSAQDLVSQVKEKVSGYTAADLEAWYRAGVERGKSLIPPPPESPTGRSLLDDLKAGIGTAHIPTPGDVEGAIRDYTAAVPKGIGAGVNKALEEAPVTTGATAGTIAGIAAASFLGAGAVAPLAIAGAVGGAARETITKPLSVTAAQVGYRGAGLGMVAAGIKAHITGYVLPSLRARLGW